MQEVQKIHSFTDLNAWKEAHKLVIMIYKITKSFPKEETYSLIDQMKRCVISITSNIVEGFERGSNKELRQFLFVARASLAEVQNQLLIAKDLGYLETGDFESLAKQSVEAHKLINGFMKSLQARSLNCVASR